MFYTNLKIAWRNLSRQFSYSLINILGLSIGLACSLVMILYVYSEWSYDRHFSKADRIYKIGISFMNIGNFGLGPEALGDFLPAEFEGIERFTRVMRSGENSIAAGEKNFRELMYYTDTSFFQVFDYEFLQGNRLTALGPNGIVLTKSMAQKYFGEVDAMGKVLLIGKEKRPYTINGIVKDDNRSSQLKAKIWVSITDKLTHEPIWTSASVYNYVLLREGTTQKDLEAALDRLLEKRIFPLGGGNALEKTFEAYKKNENSVKFFIHRLQDVHLKSTLLYEISPGGNESMLYSFGAIGMFILILAAVNFINLTTARASRRAREVGVRKAIGSTRAKLMNQFLLEAVLLCLAAMMVSLGLAELLLSVFDWISGHQLINTLWSNGWNLLMILLIAIAIGLLSGIYPAFYLTAFQPARVLKGEVSVHGGQRFRNALVVFQFAIATSLMIGLVVVLQQFSFMESRDLGFDQQHVVTIDNIGLLKDKATAFKDKLSSQASVKTSSFHTGEPGSKAVMSFSMYQVPGMEKPISINTYYGDPSFMELMGFKLVEGRGFDKNMASDSTALLLNEAAVKVMGLEKPLGTIIGETYHVIGVLKDFHWESLRSSIGPIGITMEKNPYQLGFRLQGDEQQFLRKAEAAWKELAPDEPFNYHFLDSNFGEMLKAEQVLSKAIGIFALLAIFISCLGLYGLSAFTADQRTKEIGIRKVMGASVTSIIRMLNRQYLLLVLTAVVIATPLSIWMMNKWLEGFAYRIAIDPIWILVTFISALMIALGTVSYHSLKAAMVNPSDTLKYE
ncbi:MAG TPA: ABC transporter permease [Cyclobacteriaceae bacterium]|nr:ABC transporter permease [Cyclobacteriaceae bacterium]